MTREWLKHNTFIFNRHSYCIFNQIVRKRYCYYRCRHLNTTSKLFTSAYECAGLFSYLVNHIVCFKIVNIAPNFNFSFSFYLGKSPFLIRNNCRKYGHSLRRWSGGLDNLPNMFMWVRRSDWKSQTQIPLLMLAVHSLCSMPQSIYLPL